MDNNQNWYRQLLALVLLAASRAAVEFVTNPDSREDASKQLKGAFQEIDYDAAAKAVTKVIDDLASTSKVRVSDTIDTLRDRGVDVVGDAKSKAEKQLGQKKGGRKLRFFFGLLLGSLVAYYLLDEQRRDDLMDRVTGASGPIQESASSAYQQAATTAQQASSQTSTTSSFGDGSSAAADPVSEPPAGTV